VGLIRRLGARESTRMTSNWRVTLLEELRVYIVVSTDEGEDFKTICSACGSSKQS